METEELVGEKYVECKQEARDRLKLTLENLLPPGIRRGLEDYRADIAELEATVKAVIEKLIELNESDKKFDSVGELIESKRSLEKFDRALRKCLETKIEELQTLFEFEYEPEFIPHRVASESVNVTSEMHSTADQVALIDDDTETKILKQWKELTIKLRRPVKGQFTQSFQELLKDNESVWDPRKIVVGPVTENRQAPCLIPIAEPNSVQNDELLVTDVIKINEVSEMPPITSNTQVFFKEQIQRRSYFKSLYLLTEHHKQSDLLLRSLHEAIDEYPLVKDNSRNVNVQIQCIKTNLKELVKDIEKDFNGLYALCGVNDIANITIPGSEHFYQRKYGFIEESELENLVSKYVRENRLMKRMMKQTEHHV